MKQRKVSTASASTGLITNTSGLNLKQKRSIRTRERLNRLAVTKARKFLLLALVCFVSVQVIKNLTTSVLWANETPTGLPFLVVTYLQLGLLFSTFFLLVAAAYQALKRMFSEF